MNIAGRQSLCGNRSCVPPFPIVGLYQLYFLDDDDRDIARQEHRCADDRAAVRRGRSLCMEHNIDIWDNARRVARIHKEQFRAAPRDLSAP